MPIKHEYALEIVEYFEDILDKNNIKIPDEYREGREGEACLYGQTYSDLVDDVENAIHDCVIDILEAFLNSNRGEKDAGADREDS